LIDLQVTALIALILFT